jgi:pimeloyl-ACP methyl ester carboxylesterase
MRFDRADQPVGEGIPGRVLSGQCCRLGRGSAVDVAYRTCQQLGVRSASGRPDRTYRQIIVSNFLPEGTQKEWRVFDELQRRTTSAENAWRFVNEFADIDVTDLAPRVTVPTLVIGGRRDRVGPFDQSRLMTGLIPGSRLVPLDTPPTTYCPSEIRRGRSSLPNSTHSYLHRSNHIGAMPPQAPDERRLPPASRRRRGCSAQRPR